MQRHVDALSMPSSLGILRNVGGKNRPNMGQFDLDYRLKTDGVFSGKPKGAPYTHQGSSPGVGPSIDPSRSTQKSTIQQSAARKAKKRDVRTLGLGPVEKSALDLDPEAAEDINRFMKDQFDVAASTKTPILRTENRRLIKDYNDQQRANFFSSGPE